jgi:predicted Fe-Mo cluster-binding NifX family protein
MGAGPEVSKLLSSMGPGESAMGHFRSARIEFLKGIRAIIDKQIESVQRMEPKGAKVNVE